jgi:hypothetical protein
MNSRRGVPPLGPVLLFASVVLAPAALLPFAMGVTHLRRDYLLAQDGATAEGKVDRLEAFDYSTSSTRGTETGIRVHYTFRTQNEVTYHDTATPTSPLVKGLSVGGPVRVRYVRSNPDISELESRPFIGYLLTAIGTVCLAMVLGVFVAGVRQVGFGAGRGFRECTATVTEFQDAEWIVNEERYLHVRFQFADEAGNDHWGKGPPLPPEEARAHAIGSRVRIRYDPRDPSITLWLGQAP